MSSSSPTTVSEHALATVDQTAPSPVSAMPSAFEREWRTMKEQATMLVQSGLLPKHVQKAETAVAIMLMGEELGFQRMQSFRMIQVINGTPSLNAAGMAAVVQAWIARHGGKLQPIETTETRCVVAFQRPEWDQAQQSVFTIQDAQRANLNSATWKQHPKNMLYARAVSNACRMGWPEVIGGIYDPDEVAHFSGAPAPAVVMPTTHDPEDPIGSSLGMWGTAGAIEATVVETPARVTEPGPLVRGSRAAGYRGDDGAPERTEPLSWTAFWKEAKALGVKDKDALEDRIGPINGDPDAAMAKLRAWLDETVEHETRGEIGLDVEDDNTTEAEVVEVDPNTGEVIPPWVGRDAEPATLPDMPAPKRGRRPSDQIAGIN